MLQIQTSSHSSIISKSASYEQPLELLLSCHAKVRHFSSALSKLTHAIQHNGWNDDYVISVNQVRHYFNVASSAHHQDEEKHLFPAIIAFEASASDSNDEMISLIERLTKEHNESDALWYQLDNMLAESSEDFLTLHTLSHQFEFDMHRHAQIEDDIIFPYAKKHISTLDFKKMGLAIARRRGIKV